MASDLHGARAGDDLVLLDLSAGDYSLLPGLFGKDGPGAARRAELLVELTGSAPDARFKALLLEDGPSKPRAPLTNLPELEEPLEIGWLHRRDFVETWLALGFTYIGRPLRRLLPPPRLKGVRARSAPEEERELLRRCATFARLAPWAPVQGLCLYRAFLLRAFLARGGLEATWVFGVRTWPFRAHCWLQWGRRVLNDDAERVALYAPILVI